MDTFFNWGKRRSKFNWNALKLYHLLLPDLQDQMDHL